MYAELIKSFLYLEELNTRINELDNEIIETIGDYEDPFESSNKGIVRKAKDKNLFCDYYQLLLKDTKDKIHKLNLDKINSISTSEFMGMDWNIINERLNNANIIPGVKELLQGLIINKTVDSYEPINILYVGWKIYQVFGIKVEFI